MLKRYSPVTRGDRTVTAANSEWCEPAPDPSYLPQLTTQGDHVNEKEIMASARDLRRGPLLTPKGL